jgi:prepilin-type N-terminal cleavage/methylation domain-containing protein/prepilin-type processing-associated H-X9-DG protein
MAAEIVTRCSPPVDCRKAQGFTLIELLVVIAIIAILAAILFPVFAQAKQAAKAVTGISNMKQVNLASMIYSGDYDDRIHPATRWNGSDDPIRTATGQTNASWVWLIQPYMKAAGLVIDPLGPKALSFSGIPEAVTNSTRLSIGFNQYHLSYWDGTGAGSETVSLSGVAKPAETLAYTTMTHASEWGNNSLVSNPFSNVYYFYQYGVPDVDQGPAITVMVDPPVWDENKEVGNPWTDYSLIRNPNAGRYTGRVAFRKAGKATIAFLDGHVKALSIGQVAAGTNYDLELIKSGDLEQAEITDLDAYIWDIQ